MIILKILGDGFHAIRWRLRFSFQLFKCHFYIKNWKWKFSITKEPVKNLQIVNYNKLVFVTNESVSQSLGTFIPNECQKAFEGTRLQYSQPKPQPWTKLENSSFSLPPNLKTFQPKLSSRNGFIVYKWGLKIFNCQTIYSFTPISLTRSWTK